MEVLVFKTDILTIEQAGIVAGLLDKNNQIEQFNFDLDDCDHILRIAKHQTCPREIERLLKANGISCVELAD